MNQRVDTDPRISRRRKAVARSKRRRIWMGLGAVGLIAVIVWVMFFSPVLDVRDIKVVGTKHVEAEEVAEVSGLLDSSQNLLTLATDEVAQRVEELPWVQEAEVDRMLPGTVRIKIIERTPAMILSLGAARWTVDAHGVVLEAGEVQPGLPVLAGVEVGDISEGLRLMTPEALDALRAFRSMPRLLRSEIVGVFAPTVERISFSLASGTVVRYGAAEKLEDKNEVLRVLLERLSAEGKVAAYIDVRVPTSPAISETPAPTG
jgi:cell division protein FtsQ